MDNLPASSSDWFDREVNIDAFRDKRLGERLRTLLMQLANRIGSPIPLACEDWANTKAAYRFLSNGSVSEGEILSGHFTSTCQRVASTDGLLFSSSGHDRVYLQAGKSGANRRHYLGARWS